MCHRHFCGAATKRVIAFVPRWPVPDHRGRFRNLLSHWQYMRRLVHVVPGGTGVDLRRAQGRVADQCLHGIHGFARPISRRPPSWLRRFVALSYAPFRYARGRPGQDRGRPAQHGLAGGVRQTFAAMTHLDTAVTGAGRVALRLGGFYGPHSGTQTKAMRKRRSPIIGGGSGIMSFIDGCYGPLGTRTPKPSGTGGGRGSLLCPYSGRPGGSWRCWTRRRRWRT